MEPSFLLPALLACAALIGLIRLLSGALVWYATRTARMIHRGTPPLQGVATGAPRIRAPRLAAPRLPASPLGAPPVRPAQSPAA